MYRRRTILGALMIFMGLMFGLTSVASAKGDTKKDRGLAKILGDIEWGDSKAEVLEKIKQQKLDTLRDNEKLRKDRVKMQRARKRVLDWHESVQESYTRFKSGERSGYEVSVVSNHYTSDNGESMLRARDAVAQRFFFFLDGQLYKLVVSYKQDYLQGVGFEEFAAQVAQKYGRPISTEYTEMYGMEELMLVRWQDKQTVLDIENQREFFGTFTMAFTDRDRLEKLVASDRDFGGSDKIDDDSLSSEVASLTTGEASDENRDAVSNIVGDVDIDLNEGRPKDEQVRQPEKKEKAAEKKSDAKKKTPKKAKKRKRKKKKVSKRDFSDLKEKGGDDELIIY